jgi:alpha-tubulin suppressor-like RCC1 family protein
VTVAGIGNAVGVSVGAYHSCALLGDGTARCWGFNQYGQLGNGTMANSPVPVNVSGLTSAVQLEAGWFHTCAVRSDGTARCWGCKICGERGGGTE